LRFKVVAAAVGRVYTEVSHAIRNHVSQPFTRRWDSRLWRCWQSNRNIRAQRRF